MRVFRNVSIAMLSAPLLAACSGNAPAARSPSAEQAKIQPMVPPARPVADDLRQGKLAIDRSIREACGISDVEAYFAYDSAALDPRHRDVMRRLARCFTEGPMRGRSMLLVGHADPRGDDAYNLALGGRRADSVKSMLTTEGLASNLAQTSSRGEMDAHGEDEPGWSKDRRVDVLLMD